MPVPGAMLLPPPAGLRDAAGGACPAVRPLTAIPASAEPPCLARAMCRSALDAAPSAAVCMLLPPPARRKLPPVPAQTMRTLENAPWRPDSHSHSLAGARLPRHVHLARVRQRCFDGTQRRRCSHTHHSGAGQRRRWRARCRGGWPTPGSVSATACGLACALPWCATGCQPRLAPRRWRRAAASPTSAEVAAMSHSSCAMPPAFPQPSSTPGSHACGSVSRSYRCVLRAELGPVPVPVHFPDA